MPDFKLKFCLISRAEHGYVSCHLIMIQPHRHVAFDCVRQPNIILGVLAA